MKRPVIYVASAISKGNLVENIIRANEAGLALLKAGFAPIVPHGSCFFGNRLVEGEDFFGIMRGFVPEALPAGTVAEDWYLADLCIVRRCDALLRLPGESVGADLEEAESRAAGLPVFRSVAEAVEWLAKA